MKKINPDQIKDWLLDKKVYVVAVVLAAGAFFYWQQKPQPADNSALLSQTKLQSSSQSAASRQTGASSASSAAGKVNLNTATAADLQKLNGIGERKAEQIIAYREQKGGFKSIDELKEVSGIGDKTFDALKDQITV